MDPFPHPELLKRRSYLQVLIVNNQLPLTIHVRHVLGLSQDYFLHPLSIENDQKESLYGYEFTQSSVQSAYFVKDLPQEAQDVVYEMCYQLGIGGFSKFKKTIQFLRLGDYKACSEEMLDSRWAREQTPQRAQKLSKIIREL